MSSTKSSIRSPRITTSCSRCWKLPLPSTGMSSRESSPSNGGCSPRPAAGTIRRTAHPGRPRKAPCYCSQRYALGAHHAAGRCRTSCALQKARLVSSNADIRLQAALAGHGVLRVTASFTRAAVEAGLLRRVLPDHVCEPLNVHALLPARQFIPRSALFPGCAGSACPQQCRGENRPVAALVRLCARLIRRAGCRRHRSRRPQSRGSVHDNADRVPAVPPGRDVMLYRAYGGGHRMPGMFPDAHFPKLAAALLGPQNGDIDGAETIWTFFSKFP